MSRKSPKDKAVSDAAMNGAVLTHLRLHPVGLTSYEIGRALGVNVKSGMWACVRLETKGMIRHVDELKPDSPTRTRRVWFPCETPGYKLDPK